MKREPAELAKRIEHTLLRPSAVWSEIAALCDAACAGGAAAVCIPPCYVARAAKYAAGKTRICTVIGFPNGYNTTAVKCAEAREAAAGGADELDMVVNLGLVKEARWEEVLSELRAVRQACPGKILKVIIETCQLTEEEKKTLCGLVSRSGADYIKTSTGFSTGGATVEDVALLKANVSDGVGVKAAGGIRTAEFAWELVEAGADRIGASAVLPLLMVEKEDAR